MTTVSDADLLASALAALNPRRLSSTAKAGDVGCALTTATGVLHIGVSIDVACGIGFCAEHSAIASMITAGESQIVSIVAVSRNRNVLSPCGRCRELICQVDPANVDARVMLPGAKVVALRDLLPDHWLLNQQW